MNVTNTRERLANELRVNFMVEAAAGTGKTTSMVTRMLRLLAEGECTAEQMAAVTFTRKAAAELRERFQRELKLEIERLSESDAPSEQSRREKLMDAAASLGQMFIGTIHSFCALLIRQRPIEFDVHPGFRELEADENQLLMDRAWQENLADMVAADDPLLSELKSVGLESSQLRSCFDNFVEYRDVKRWPSDPASGFDFDACKNATRQYIDDMRALLPSFLSKRTTDKLMSRYEQIVRSSARSFDSEPRFFRMLELFDHSDGAVFSQWHDAKVAKREKERFNKFRAEQVEPALTYWRQRRYQYVVQFVRRALSVYERIKQMDGALDFTDLLIITAKGLREQPHLRSYFQQRFTHLLVDEFQDTDPLQAEAIVLLGASDASEKDWHQCRLRPGGLFIVGDPKQSIYRFRRGDIVTYNRVKSIVTASAGEIVALAENYRSSEELLAWNNGYFAEKFPKVASDEAPAHTPMQCGRPRQVRGELSGIYRLPVQGRFGLATANEAESIARFIRHAVASQQTIERWSATDNAFLLQPVRPRDFLIITRVRARIAVYKAALERHGIPCEVSGCNSFEGHGQLLVLLDILRAADDPYNQVHTLSLLRERLFGFSDAELYELKKAGGSFVFTADLPDQLDGELGKRFERCYQQLRVAQLWLRTLPPVVALERIAEQFGLLAEAAAADDGNIALGSLFKALEVLRVQSHQFDNAADLIEGIEQLLEIEEADSLGALDNTHDAVRIMNLHKAKGLEAPIVFLADTAKPAKYPPLIHVSRQGLRPNSSTSDGGADEEPRGAMCITARVNAWQTKSVAEPVGWDRFQAQEQRFLDAEEDRLLYVAATRAANMLVVSLGDTQSTWSELSDSLQSAPDLSIPTDEQLGVHSLLGCPAIQAEAQTLEQSHGDDCDTKWQAVQVPSYSHVSVKEESLHGSRRPDWQSEGEYGMVWGLAMHELLEIAGKQPAVDLPAQALAAALQHDLPSSRVDELIETVRAVIESDIWQRSRAALRCYSELPFDVSSDRDGQPAIIRGVIDLIFEEPDGWVIVDYKSDNLNIDDVDSVCDYYRPQLSAYALHWEELTGFKVKELGIFLTRLREYFRV